MENYTFVVQDAVQSFHWNNGQVAFHPLVVYFIKDGKLPHKTSDSISDRTQHDVFSVYAFQIPVINEFMKVQMPQIYKLFISAMGAVDNKKPTKKFHTCFITNVTLIYLYFCIFLLPVMENKCLWHDWWYQIKHLAAYASLQQAAKCQIVTQKDL